MHSLKLSINLLKIHNGGFVVCGSCHVPSQYLNTMVGKDISLLNNRVLHMWLEDGHIHKSICRLCAMDVNSCTHLQTRAMRHHICGVPFTKETKA